MIFGRKDDFESLMDSAIEELEKGRPDRAEPLVRDALEAAEREDGPVSESVHDALMVLGDVLSGTGDVEAAEPITRRRLQVASELWGSSDERTAAALYSLANVLGVLDEAEEAERLYRDALAIVGDGEGEFEEASVLAALGALIAGPERFDEAEPLLMRALELERTNLEPLGVWSEAGIPLGVGLRMMGRLEESRSVLSETVAALEGDPETDPSGLVMSLNQLSATLAELERLEEARGAMARAIAAAVMTGAPPEVMAELFRNEAELLDSVRDEGADGAWERMLTQIERFDEQGIGSADLLYAYGDSLYERGESERAREVLERSLALFEAAEEFEEAATVLNRLAGALVDIDLPEEGERAYRRALTLLDEAGAEPDEREAYCLANLGELLVEMGRPGEAVDVLEDSVQIAGEVFGDVPAARVTPHVRLGDAYGDMGRVDDALASYDAALEAARESGDLYTEDVALAMRGRALCLLDRGDVDEGVELVWQAVDLFETIGGEDGPPLVMLTVLVGPVLLGAFRASDALRLAERSLAVLTEDAGPWIRADLALLQGSALAELDRHADAERALREGLTFAQEVENPGDTPHYLRRVLASALMELGRHDEAEELLGVGLDELGDMEESEERSALEGMLLAGLGRMHSETGSWVRAEETLRRALAIHEQQEGTDSPELAWGLSRLALAVHEQGRAQEAAELAKRARSLAELLSSEDPDLPELEERLAGLP